MLWLVALVVLVLFLALMLHGGVRAGRCPSFRFLFYIPVRWPGSASVLVWLSCSTRTVSPWHFVSVAAFHFSELAQTIAPGHLPAIFAVIAFWTGRWADGSWS